MDKYLQWHGIIGFTGQILSALETICQADSDNPAHKCQELVDYMWDAEEKSFREEYGDAEPADQPHIFCTLVQLRHRS